ncbi:MAG: mechanosensitive ion channel family protein [Halobacteria archaeon]|nr:mechanosensitive ion channel family protein [Halobacteria archaeon]
MSIASEYTGLIQQIGILIFTLVVLYTLGVHVGKPAFLKLLVYIDADRRFKYAVRRFGNFLAFVVALILSTLASDFGEILAASAVVLAATTVAVGVAAREVTSNFISGIVIIADTELNYGDWIKFGEVEGTITDIGYRATRIRKFNNEKVTVPNSQLVANQVTNVSVNQNLRLEIEFGIDYDDDIDTAREILIQEAFAHDEILESPEPGVYLREFAGSYVALESRVWLKDPDRSNVVEVRSEYSQRVKERFEDVGIQIQPPSPQKVSGSLEINRKEPRTED